MKEEIHMSLNAGNTKRKELIAVILNNYIYNKCIYVAHY